MNEGFTTYLERKIVAKLHGEQERHLRCISELASKICAIVCTYLLVSFFCRWMEEFTRNCKPFYLP